MGAQSEENKGVELAGGGGNAGRRREGTCQVVRVYNVGGPATQIESSVDKMSATTATSAKGQTPPAHVGMFQLLNGVFVTGAISCLARLGVPDLVEHGPKSADELAKQMGADPRALYRLMRATAAVGVLSEGPDGKFSETPLSAVLRSNARSEERR